MKCLPFAAAFAALIPSLVHAQTPQFTDCRTLRAAGNFVGPDEALVNGLVCKMAKPKTNSAPSKTATGKDLEKSKALLGIIEPEILRSEDKEGANAVAATRGASLAASDPAAGKTAVKSTALLGVIEPEILRVREKAETNPAGEPPTAQTSLGSQSSGYTASGAPQPPSFEMIPAGSLGDIARSYRKDAGTRVTARPEEEVLQQKKLSPEAERVSTTSHKAPVPASIAEAKPSGKSEVSAVAGVPKATVKPEITPAATVPILATPAAAPQTAKKEVAVALQAHPVEIKPEAIAATVAPPAAVPAVKSETNLPAVVATPASAPKAQDAVRSETVEAAQKPPAQTQSETRPAASASEEAPVPEPERTLQLGAFVVPKPPPETDPLPQPVRHDTAEESAFLEGQAPNCTKNISLGSMEQEKLFLAIPEWALKWYEKNQKRFPGICFSNSLMSGAQNYLVVFNTSAPRLAETGSLKNISATEEMTPVNGKGSFTTSYGRMWHYTYEKTITTTITSVSAEKAPHNQQTTLLYATAYSEQGIPMSQHWPTPNTKSSKETSTKHRKNQDVLIQESRVMTELLSQMVEDIAKL